MSDQNFDSLAHKFTHNIYGTIKGQIRLEILNRDLNKYTPLQSQKLRILDAGGGIGYLSRQLAAQGHEVVLCDISDELLHKAQQEIEQFTPNISLQLLHCSIQKLPKNLGKFDLILCHAVLEWLEDGYQTLSKLQEFLSETGHFSLMFYNLEAQRFHALVCGNFSYINNGLKAKKTVRLTPQHAYLIQDIRKWFKEWQLTEVATSGVRVINDYLKAGARQQFNESELIDMELKYSTHPAYLELGRYIHIIGSN
ncbi:MAG: tRNA 5-carboxymethoxyuridine methyltransferase [Candidatus Celerinatantimonas neptuna]|nr:MAG: tRNA 5-carboxymethoxyuridine methyltransferase [Candidatus Celerinatantimonas neptuna]